MSKVSIEFITSKDAFLLKEQMWSIYTLFFEISEKKFYDRIKETPQYTLYKVKSKIVGFTGIYRDILFLNNKKIYLLGFGSTVLLPEFRGKFLLQKTCLTLRLKLLIKAPLSKIFFWCHASSYKTYCNLASFRHHYPRHNQYLPNNYREIIDFIGNTKFGSHYDKLNQTAVYNNIQNKDSENFISKKHLNDPEIAFFHNKINNSIPGSQGINGLITIAPMNRSNISYRLRDFILKRKRKRININEILNSN